MNWPFRTASKLDMTKSNVNSGSGKWDIVQRPVVVDRKRIKELFLSLVKTLLPVARYQKLVHVTYKVVHIPLVKRLNFRYGILQKTF